MCSEHKTATTCVRPTSYINAAFRTVVWDWDSSVFTIACADVSFIQTTPPHRTMSNPFSANNVLSNEISY